MTDTHNAPGAAAVLYVALAQAGFAVDPVEDAEKVLASINAQGLRLDTIAQHGRRQDGFMPRSRGAEPSFGQKLLDGLLDPGNWEPANQGKSITDPTNGQNGPTS